MKLATMNVANFMTSFLWLKKKIQLLEYAAIKKLLMDERFIRNLHHAQFAQC